MLDPTCSLGKRNTASRSTPAKIWAGAVPTAPRCTADDNRVLERSLVNFLHEVTYAALQGIGVSAKRRWTLAKHERKAFPLHEHGTPRQARPDIFLLPDAAFEERWGPGVATLDERWLNWTAVQVVGECKTSKKQSADGLTQAVRYREEQRRVQPWQATVLALSYSVDAVGSPLISVIRVDQSRIEKCELDLSTSIGVFDFVRLLAGLAIMDEEGLGKMSEHGAQLSLPVYDALGLPKSGIRH